MSEADLLALKGPPSGKISAGARSVYKWPDLQVTVENGVVSRVSQVRAPAAMEVPKRYPEPVFQAPSKQPVHYTSNFQTHWQDESQYIVENISADLVEMYAFARTGAPPRSGELTVEAEERGETTYLVRVKVGPKPPIEATLSIQRTIFSAETYQPLMNALAAEYGALRPVEGTAIGGLLDTLTEPRADLIEIADQNISTGLEKNFSSPDEQEQAALVLAAFALREHSGKFFQILSELCRMSAHLAFSSALRAGTPPSTDGRIAEAAMLCLLNNEADSQAILSELPESEPGVGPWRRALALRNTYDLRKYESPAAPSLLEEFARFDILLLVKGEGTAWGEVAKLSDARRSLPDWGRIASGVGYGPSVGVGHTLLKTLLPSEFAEMKTVFELVRAGKFSKDTMIDELNIQPGHCVSLDSGGTPHVHVIGRGIWSAFLQRHLCQAVASDFDFLQRKWGVPDDARDFLKEVDGLFWGLELYPFVRRLDATNESYYHSAQDDEMALVRSTPQVVPAEAWNYVSYGVPFCPRYYPPPHPFINEWHKHNPPQGTAYNFYPRLNHPSLINQPDTVARLERLHAIAPWEPSLTAELLARKFGGHPTGEQAEEGYKDVSSYSPYACAMIADAFTGSPAAFEKWMARAAELSPKYYYDLADYYKKNGRDADAAAAYENAFGGDDDPVRVANRSEWIVKYYEAHGRSGDATRLADKAAEVYSAAGLETKASLLEGRHDLNGALELYRAVYERYNNAVPMLRFLLRAEKADPSTKFESELDAISEKAVTGGLKVVELGSLTDPPADGMRVSFENDQTRRADLRLGDVIVAVYGYRIRDFHSYLVLRELGAGPLEFIIWRSGAYMSLSASPPDKHFGVDFSDYRAK